MKKRPPEIPRGLSAIRAKATSFLASAVVFGLTGVISAQPAAAQQAPAAGQLQCDAHDKITKHLGAQFTEDPVSLGLARNGKVVQVFSTEDGETWTIVMTAPEGVSCIVAAGKYWQNLPVVPKGPVA